MILQYDFIIIILTLIFVNTLYALYPNISRKTISFSVSIPENIFNHESIVKIRALYRTLIIVCSSLFLLILISLYLSIPGGLPEFIPAVLLILNLGLNLCIYFFINKKMIRLKKEYNWGIDTPQLITVETGFRKARTLISPFWFILHALIILITVLLTALLYDHAPDKLTSLINLGSQTLNKVNKTWTILLLMPVTQVFVTAVFAFAYSIISKARIQIDAGNREISLEQNRISRKRWSIFLVTVSSILLITISISQFHIMGFIDNTINKLANFVIFVLILIAVFVISVANGQSGSRIKVGNTHRNTAIVRDDDRHWKLGIFYFNPDDTALFVEKRMGVGWTFNWGKPMAWIIIIALLLTIAVFSIINSTALNI